MTRSARREVVVEADEVGDELEPGDDLGSEDRESSGEPAGCARAGEGSYVDSELGLITVGEPGEAVREELDLLGIGAFLWGKDLGCFEKTRRHIAGGDELGTL